MDEREKNRTEERKEGEKIIVCECGWMAMGDSRVKIRRRVEIKSK